VAEGKPRKEIREADFADIKHYGISSTCAIAILWITTPDCDGSGEWQGAPCVACMPRMPHRFRTLLRNNERINEIHRWALSKWVDAFWADDDEIVRRQLQSEGKG